MEKYHIFRFSLLGPKFTLFLFLFYFIQFVHIHVHVKLNKQKGKHNYVSETRLVLQYKILSQAPTPKRTIGVSQKTNQHISPSPGNKLLNIKRIHSAVLSPLQYSYITNHFLGPKT